MNVKIAFLFLSAFVLSVAVSGAVASTNVSLNDCSVSVEREYSFRCARVFEGVIENCGGASGFVRTSYGANAAIVLSSTQNDVSKALTLRHEYCHWSKAQTSFEGNAFVEEVECYLTEFNPAEYLS
jgi:hypothetical protein